MILMIMMMLRPVQRVSTTATMASRRGFANVGVHDSHMAGESVAAGEGLVLHAVFALDARSIAAMNRFLMASQVIGAREERPADSTGCGVVSLTAMGSWSAVSRLIVDLGLWVDRWGRRGCRRGARTGGLLGWTSTVCPGGRTRGVARDRAAMMGAAMLC